jgi:hypothetical protein
MSAIPKIVRVIPSNLRNPGFILLLLVLSGAARANDPKLSTKLLKDSTNFTMSVDASQPHKVGSTFEVDIHVKPHVDWHVWSHDMSADGGLLPLNVVIPEALSKYFKIVGIRETGEVRQAYDSAFEIATRAHYSEYDVQVIVKVLEASPTPTPFYVYVNYQTCNEIFCLPPAWFQVPMTVRGEKPVDLSLAMAEEKPAAGMMRQLAMNACKAIPISK